jgi:hypothetical protein
MADKDEHKPIPVKPEVVKQPENLTLAQKLKMKVDEVLDGEKDLKPEAAERVNQIVNDAVVSMPPKIISDTPQEKPEVALAHKLKTQIDAAVANSDITPELAAKLEALFADIEAAFKTEKPPVPATGPIPVKA